MKKQILFLLFFTLMLSCNGQDAQHKKLNAREFQNEVKETQNALVVDVRTPEEFENGHLDGALNVDWRNQNFEEKILKVDKNQPVFVYCMSGRRSAKAIAKMKELGFSNIVEMSGGMIAWRGENLPESKTKKANSKAMTLEQFYAKMDSDRLVLVDFYANWCAPCKQMRPYLEKIEKENKVQLIYINADENPELLKQLKVSALPVLRMYKNKKQLWENIGFINEEGVREQLDKN
ncbi:MAG: thioredoxin domain-containing protein [Flavobacteriaceae bacterium]|nr:thioredoxin domain-containing protein [Flavobacteriaceae bacterium]